MLLRLANELVPIAIHAKCFDGRAANRSQANDVKFVPGKVIRPWISPRMKKPYGIAR